ncbi:hypothetical protein [Streptomyces sp. NPDC020742]|uniref:hypothetical protein n=1 Tax=Streptomyces sp. NPDC020742 TaxID=3154897 RepID=UPI0033C224EF
MTTADLPMLLPPALVEDPSPLNVSTFAKPEYANLTFTYGKVKSGGNWPVHCKWFKVRIPTGRQASALTSEPSLIRYELTVPTGKRQWAVERDSRDPNQTIFTCSPPPNEHAAFDGTWSVQLELWGIEVNGGIGPVDIVRQESVSTTGADGPYEERTGKGGVSKSDDSFYLHSFRPASVAVSRNTKATLHWEGTPHAKYTMYYRKPDGTQGSSTVTKDGEWSSPENLVDDTSFTLEAKMKNEVRYLTTYIKVNNPDITVNNVTANGNVTVDGEKELKVGRLRGAGQYPSLKIESHITANSEDPGRTIAFQSKFTTSGPVTANGDVTIATAKTLTVETIKSPENGALTIVNMPSKENAVKKVKASFADGILSVTGNEYYSGAISTISIAASEINGRGGGALALNGIVTVNGLVTANEGITLAAKKSIKTDYINARVPADGIVVGNNMRMYEGMTLTTNGIIAEGGISAKGGFGSNGKWVIKAGDEIALQSTGS